MISLNCRNINDLTWNLFQCFKDKNQIIEAAPRGKRVIQLRDRVAWTLSHPWECWLTIPGRRLNPFFAAAEIFWILAGRSDAAWIKIFNKNFSSYEDPGAPWYPNMHAAYGQRIFGYTTADRSGKSITVDQVACVVEKLRADPQTRQAVISLWHPVYDNLEISNDYSCNVTVMFDIRDDALNISIVIRSNDFIWGTPYNMLQFVHLQALIAGELGKRLGTYTVFCNNLHIYTDLYPDQLAVVDQWAASPLADLYYGSGINRSGMSISRLCFEGVWDLLHTTVVRAITPYYFSYGEVLKLQMTLDNLHPYFGNLAMIVFLGAVRIRQPEVLRWGFLDDLYPDQQWAVRDFLRKQKSEESTEEITSDSQKLWE